MAKMHQNRFLPWLRSSPSTQLDLTRHRERRKGEEGKGREREEKERDRLKPQK